MLEVAYGGELKHSSHAVTTDGIVSEHYSRRAKWLAKMLLLASCGDCVSRHIEGENVVLT